jgi:hypothetical protein
MAPLLLFVPSSYKKPKILHVPRHLPRLQFLPLIK